MTQPESALPQNLAPTPELDSSREQFVGLLTGIANHEAKLALTAIIASQPSQWFGESGLWNEVRLRQGERPGWIPDRKGPIKYCQNSLGPIGLVAKGLIAGERGDVIAYTANDEQPEVVERGLALSGALMDWSLEFPEISVQKVLGVTAGRGAYRTPEARYGILKELVDNFGAPLTYMDIAKPITSEAIDERNIFASIRELTDGGILSTAQIDVAEDVLLEICAPYSYSGKGLHFDQMTDHAQLAYKAIDGLWEQGRRVISFKEFADQTLSIEPEADLSKLRQVWYYGSSTDYENMPGLKPVDRKMNAPSIVTLSPVHAEAVVDLVRRLRDIENPNATTMDYRELARESISSPDKTAALYAKARKFSSSASGQEESSQVVESQIKNIVAEAGSLTTESVFEAFKQSGRVLTEGSIRTYLGKLAKDGVLSAEKRKLDPTKKREYIFYSIQASE